VLLKPRDQRWELGFARRMAPQAPSGTIERCCSLIPFAPQSVAPTSVNGAQIAFLKAVILSGVLRKINRWE